MTVQNNKSALVFSTCSLSCIAALLQSKGITIMQDFQKLFLATL